MLNKLLSDLRDIITSLYLNYFFCGSATYGPEYFYRYRFFGSTKEDLEEFTVPTPWAPREKEINKRAIYSKI